MTGTAGTETISAALVERAQAGDDEALEAVVALAYPIVHRWALVHTGSAADADDLTQDVLLQVVRRIGSFRGESRFSSWLYQVTRNAALDRGRDRQRRDRVTTDAEVDHHTRPSAFPSPDRRTERAELQDILRTFLRILPHRQREAVQLVDFEGLDSAEAAAEMGIEAVSVRAHLHKARAALRTHILNHHSHLAEDCQ